MRKAGLCVCLRIWQSDVYRQDFTIEQLLYEGIVQRMCDFLRQQDLKIRSIHYESAKTGRAF